MVKLTIGEIRASNCYLARGGEFSDVEASVINHVDVERQLQLMEPRARLFLRLWIEGFRPRDVKLLMGVSSRTASRYLATGRRCAMYELSPW